MYTLSFYNHSPLFLVPYKKTQVGPLVSSLATIGVRNNYTLNYSVTRSYSTGSSNLNPGSWSLFNFKYLPHLYPYHKLILPGFEAVDSVSLRGKLEESLASAASYSSFSKKAKIRLVFSVVYIPPVEIFDRRRAQGNPLGFVECLSMFKSYLQQRREKATYEKLGIEFIFGYQVVNGLAEWIKDVIEYQDKDPEKIQILITFWNSVDDDKTFLS